MGVADRNTIADARMTASTISDYRYQPYYGRLNGNWGTVGAWCPKTSSDRTDYLQVDMGAVHFVCAVATQGTGNGGAWVTSYKLHLSLNGATFTAYTENNAEKVRKLPEWVALCLKLRLSIKKGNKQISISPFLRSVFLRLICYFFLTFRYFQETQIPVALCSVHSVQLSKQGLFGFILCHTTTGLASELKYLY